MEASDWKGLHPASVVVNLLPTAYRALRSLWPFVLALIVQGGRSEEALFNLVSVGVLLVLPIAKTVVHWATLRYRVDRGNLIIQTGLLNRQVRTIPPERIQNVELVRNVFHRMSGLVELRVETASGKEIEGMLSALSVDEAESLLQKLDAARAEAPEPTAEGDLPALVVNGPKELLWYGLTTTRFGLVLVVLGVVYEVLLTDQEWMQSLWGALGAMGMVVVVLGLVLGAWLTGAALSLIRHWDYRLSSLGDRLIAEEGLFTRRRVELPLSKVQLVSIREPFVRRILGVGSLHIETAAAREGGGGTQQAEAVIPVVQVGDISAIVRHALGDSPEDLEALTYHPPHPKALLRAWLGGATVASLVATGLSWAFWPWGLISWVLVPIDMLQSWLDHRYQGWWLGERYLVSRTGWWVRSTWVVSLEKLQSVEVVQGPLARRWDLAALRLRVAGSGVSLPILSYEAALDLEVELIKTSLLVSSGGREGVAPTFYDDQHATEQQDPGDGFVHQTHEEEGEEHHTLPLGVAPVVAPGSNDGPKTKGTGTECSDSEGVAQGRGAPVEADLPERGGSRLQQEDHAFADDEGSERDLHTGNKDSQD